MVGGVHSLAPATWLSGDRPDNGLRRRQHVHHARSGHRAAHRPEHDAAVAGSSRRKPPTRWPPAAARRASTTPRSRSATPHSPLPMEYNPRKVFIQLFGEGDTPRGARRDLEPDEEPARPHHRPHARAAARSRSGRSGGAGQLSGDGARDRAARAAGVEPRPVGHRGARGAGRRAATRSTSRSS